MIGHPHFVPYLQIPLSSFLGQIFGLKRLGPNKWLEVQVYRFVDEL